MWSWQARPCLSGTTTGGAASAESSPTAPYGASTDGLSAPIWDTPPPGFSPGQNPQQSPDGEFLSAEAEASISNERSAPANPSPSSPNTSLIGCTPATGGDYPHISSTGWAVSAHGWWNKGTCSGTTAHVTVRLYEWYTNGSSGGWVFKAKGGPTQRKRYDSGGGRVTARKDCEASTQTDWLNVVDVDVDGQIDSSNVLEKKRTVPCRVWSTA